MTATESRPTSVDALVASRIGRNTSVGSSAPCCARYMKMVTGNNVSEEALSTKKRICALLAVVELGLSSCSARMALSPIGVAALSRPKPLAAKFRVIKPNAGWPGGTSGIRRWNNGPSTLASHSTTPAFSAIFRKPSQRVRVPNSNTMTSTDNLAMAKMLSTMAAKIPALPPTNHCASADTAATTKNPSQRPLSISYSPTQWAE